MMSAVSRMTIIEVRPVDLMRRPTKVTPACAHIVIQGTQARLCVLTQQPLLYNSRKLDPCNT